jgi:hypothetical protein
MNAAKKAFKDRTLCAVAVRLNVPIFTSDKGFGFYQQRRLSSFTQQ